MKQFTVFVAIILAAFSANAQFSIKVSEGNESFNNGSHNALVVTVYEQEEKEVEKMLKQELKRMGGKVSTKKELFADDCKDKRMGDNTFDVYAKVTPKNENEIEVAVAVDLGGAYMSSSAHNDQFKVMEDILHDFGVSATRAAIGNELKDQEKILEGFEKEQKELERDKEQLEKSIADNEKRIEQAKEDIEQAEKDIEQNKSDQEMKKSVILEQQSKVKEVEKKIEAVK